MVAAEPVADTAKTTELSSHAIMLISFLRGHKSVFQPGEGFSATTSLLFKKNDTARLFTPQNELDINTVHLPGVSVASVMVAKQKEYVNLAVTTADAHMGTAESDSTISDILRYNFTALLRAISYGAACQLTDFVHMNNIGMMRMLHEDMGVAHATVAAALNAVKDEVLAVVADDADVVKSTSICFDIIIDGLE